MSKYAKYLTPFLFAVSGAGLAHAENVAIVGGTVYTMDDGEIIENGTVLIEDEEIERVGGPDTSIPEGYRTIDATGKWVTPGLMNAFTQIGTVEVSLESATQDNTIEDTFYTAGFDVRYGINPNSPTIPIARIEGMTRAVVVPGFAIPFSQNPNKSVFAGQAAVMHLGDGFDLIVKPQAAVMAYLGNQGASRVGGARGAAMAYLKGALEEASQDPRDNGGNGKFLKSPADRAALGRVVSGEVPLYVNEDQASYILQLLELKEEFEDLNLVILSGAEAWMVADQLAEAEVPVVFAGTSNLPGSFESLGATLYNAARLEEAGVKIAIIAGTFSLAHNPRIFVQDAGVAVAHGMSWQGAMEAITVNPAEIFGIDDDYGTLERGKDADVVVWDGDPLEVMTSPDHVFIRGQEIPLESRQTKLRDRYLDLDEERPQAYDK